MAARDDYAVGDVAYGDWSAETWTNDVPVSGSPANSITGMAQITALLGGYVSRRVDLDIQRRALEQQASLQLRTTQTPVSLQRSQSGSMLSFDLGALLPFAAVAVVVYLLARARA